jgi:two-component system chemotaxis response regulator CheY
MNPGRVSIPIKKGKMTGMSKRILIVDDSSMMRKMIRKTLDGRGHSVVGEAKDGQEAIQLYKQLEPDVVTMDITMRGMDGFTAAKEILTYDQKAQIIFLSNLNDESYSEDAVELGAVGYVNKSKSTMIIDMIEN